MASGQQHPTLHSYAGLPAELVRRVYSNCGSLSDRLRALAVCKSWQQALLSLPFDKLWLSHQGNQNFQLSTETKLDKQCRWLIARRAAFREINLHGLLGACQKLVPAMLHSVNREVLEELVCDYAYERLPCPSIFPNLAALHLMEFVWDAHWLAQLSRLPQLRQLGLYCIPGSQAPLQLHALPALSALTRLTVRFEFQATLRVVLSPTLPALQELTVISRGEVEILAVGEVPGLQAAAEVAEGPAGLAAPAAATAAAAAGAAGAAAGAEAYQPTAAAPCAIHTLQLGGSSITVDFGALPALRDLSLLGCGALAGAPTLAGACALRSLHIDGTGDYGGLPSQLTAEWVTELLRAAPASLQNLHMEGLWGPQQAAVIGGLLQLRLLTFDGDDSVAAASAEDSVPPEDGVLWRSLRALQWFNKAPLPEGLRHATQLQLLSYSTSVPTLLEMDLLAALPALRCLWVGTDTETDLEEARRRRVLLSHLTRLQEATLWIDDDSEFVGAVNALLGFIS